VEEVFGVGLFLVKEENFVDETLNQLTNKNVTYSPVLPLHYMQTLAMSENMDCMLSQTITTTTITITTTTVATITTTTIVT